MYYCLQFKKNIFIKTCVSFCFGFMYISRSLAFRANMRPEKNSRKTVLPKNKEMKKPRNQIYFQNSHVITWSKCYKSICAFALCSLQFSDSYVLSLLSVFSFCVCVGLFVSLYRISTIFELFCDPSQIPWWNHFESHIFPRNFYCYLFFC